MKGKFKYTTLLLLALLVLGGCKPEELVLDPAPSKLDGINGTFTLSEVTQVDPFVLAGTNSLDVTSVYTAGTVPSITFSKSDFTYTYIPGDAPDYLGGSGTWAFDDNDYPKYLTFTTGSGIIRTTLLHTIRPQDEYLEFSLNRSCGGQTTIVYQFKFARN
jgi:hypothetical protein